MSLLVESAFRILLTKLNETWSIFYLKLKINWDKTVISSVVISEKSFLDIRVK